MESIMIINTDWEAYQAFKRLEPDEDEYEPEYDDD